MSAYKDYVFGIQEDIQSLITEDMVLDCLDISELYLKVGLQVEKLPNGEWLLMTTLLHKYVMTVGISYMIVKVSLETVLYRLTYSVYMLY